MHFDDLSPEVGTSLRGLKPKAIAAFYPNQIAGKWRWSDVRIAHSRQALLDGATRAQDFFGGESVPLDSSDADDLAEKLSTWAKANKLDAVVAYRPFVGEISDLIPSIHQKLLSVGVRLLLIRRPCDQFAFQFASRGFFDFWQSIKPRIPELIRKL